MSNCLPLDCSEDVPVPTPTPLPPCEEGEGCDEVVDAECVVYTNEALPFVNVDTNDRLNDIIRKWAETTEGGTQAIATLDTDTMDVEGNGTSVAPLEVSVKVSEHADNLLEVVDYIVESVHYVGLEVLLTDAVIGRLLARIAANEDLNEQFCTLVRPCLNTSCNLATGLVVITSSDSSE